MRYTHTCLVIISASLIAYDPLELRKLHIFLLDTDGLRGNTIHCNWALVSIEKGSCFILNHEFIMKPFYKSAPVKKKPQSYILGHIRDFQP